MNWRTHLKFPEEAKLTQAAKDLISKLLCSVNQRLGSKGAYEIKVLHSVLFANLFHQLVLDIISLDACLCRRTLGLTELTGIGYTI